MVGLQVRRGRLTGETGGVELTLTGGAGGGGGANRSSWEEGVGLAQEPEVRLRWCSVQ